MKYTEVITLFGVFVSVILGIISIVISFKNRRNVLREKVYEKHLNLFLSIQEKIGKMDQILSNINQVYSNNDKLVSDFELIVDEFDLLIDINSFLIPDSLYKQISGYVSNGYVLLKELTNDTNNFNTKKYKDFLGKTVDLEEDIREYLGIEKLSTENNKLAKKIISN